MTSSWHMCILCLYVSIILFPWLATINYNYLVKENKSSDKTTKAAYVYIACLCQCITDNWYKFSAVCIHFHMTYRRIGQHQEHIHTLVFHLLMPNLRLCHRDMADRPTSLWQLYMTIHKQNNNPPLFLVAPTVWMLYEYLLSSLPAHVLDFNIEDSFPTMPVPLCHYL